MLSSNDIKDMLTVEDIIKICCSLQNDNTVFYDAHNNPIFLTCLDHPDGDSWKLYYYNETKTFKCYTGSGSTYDIFELVQNVKQCTFREAFNFVLKFFNIKETGFQTEESVDLISDWDIFQKVSDFNNKIELPEVNKLQENLLEYFYPLAAPQEWTKEGITPEVLYHYGIRVDSALSKIIIPQRTVSGELIGIRGRSYNQFEIDSGKKYMPVSIEGLVCNAPTSRTLFGIYENKETIRKTKRVLLVEGEKSVLKIASIYGVNNCWALATYGSTLSEEHIQALLSLGVEQVVLGYDREFNGKKGDEDTIAYEQKLLKVVKSLTPYVEVGIIMDYDHLTDYKDSPVDKGKEVFETLFHNRIRIPTDNGVDPIKKRGKR